MPPYFSYKKSRQKKFPPKYITLFLRKLLKFQETFLEKFLASGFGAKAPTDNTHKKTRHCRVFLIRRKKLELRSKPPSLTFLIRKVSKRISRRTHHFTLAKLLRFQRTFHEKSFVSGFGAKAPTDNAEANSTAPRAVSLYKQKTSRHMSACRIFD